MLLVDFSKCVTIIITLCNYKKMLSRAIIQHLMPVGAVSVPC